MNRRIVITGDILRVVRTDHGSLFCAQAYNIDWLYRILNGPLAALGFRPEQLAWDFKTSRDWLFRPVRGERLVKEMFASFGLDPCMESWARIFYADPSSKLSSLIRREFEGAIVVTFEVPPVMEKAFKAARVPLIDVQIHPIRFLNDALLSFRSTSAIMDAAFSAYALDESTIAAEVARHRAAASADSDFDYLDGSAVFFAQMQQDRSVITNGRFLAFDDIVAELMAVVGGRRLYVKAHPLQTQTEIVQGLVAKCGAKLVEGNTYRLLASKAEFLPITWTSSVAYEARAFGREPIVLGQAIPPGVPVLFEYAGRQFWSHVLHGARLEDCDDVRFIPNRLRNTINERWSYEPV